MTETATIRDRLLDNERQLGSFFLEREDVVRMALVAFLTREHVLWVGPPGTAKSLLARSISFMFSDATHREFLLSRQTTEADVIAHKDIPAYMSGTERWISDGHLTDAHFAFADEIFKASGSTLNAMLAWLNERVLKGVLRSPLRTCIGASNEFGEDESLAALRDRFTIAHVVEPIQKREHLLSYLRDRADGREVPALQPVLLSELELAGAAAMALPIEDAVFEALADLQTNLAGVGVQVSDRTSGKVVGKILKAYAWLDGADEVGVEHLECLRHVLWSDQSQIPAVEAALGTIDKGIVGEIRTIVEDATRDYYRLTAQRNADGSWNSAAAEREYRLGATKLAVQLQEAGRSIQDRFGKGVPERVKRRAREYMSELKEAFNACKRDSDLVTE